MQRTNVLASEPTAPDGRFGLALGLRWLGASVHDLAADAWTLPYRYHLGVEEWLHVVAGAPTLREVSGERTLSVGETVCFPSGPAGAHAVRGPGRVVLFSGSDSDKGPAVSVLPDTGELRVRPPGRGERAIECRAVDGREALPTLPRRPALVPSGVEVDTGSTDPPGFQMHYRRLGPLLGAELIGGAVWQLAPGTRSGPYHYEVGNEECLLVLAGTPILRHPGGRDVLAVGDLVLFPDGPDGAHQLVNESTTDARVLLLSTMREPYGAAYPDSGKLSTIGGMFRLADTVDYWHGESADAGEA